MGQIFKTRSLLFAIVVLAVLSVATRTQSAGQEAWQDQITQKIEQPRFRNADWGIKVVSLDTGRTLFEYNSHKFFQPASNAKLFTAAFVLDRLGTGYRIRTDVSSVEPPNEEGVIQGDVYVLGRGDPTFSAQWRGGDPDRIFDSMVAVFTNAGVRRISGDLVGDETALSGLTTGWMWEDLEYGYGARPSALSYDGNTLKLRASPGLANGQKCRVEFVSSAPGLQILNHSLTVSNSPGEPISARRLSGMETVLVAGQMQRGAEDETLKVPVTAPAQRFMDKLAGKLGEAGIVIEGNVRVRTGQEPAPQAQTLLGTVESPPLNDIVREMLKESDNLTASLLFAHAAARLRPNGGLDPGSTGVEALHEFCLQMGLPAEEVWIEEGSGLSRNSLATPNAIVALLQHAQAHKNAAVFMDALPLAGVDGTLETRFKGTLAAGNLRAKTGTLRWAQDLSGYVTSKAGEHLAFSIMLNRYLPPDGLPGATEEVDEIAVLVAGLEVRSDDSTPPRK